MDVVINRLAANRRVATFAKNLGRGGLALFVPHIIELRIGVVHLVLPSKELEGIAPDSIRDLRRILTRHA